MHDPQEVETIETEEPREEKPLDVHRRYEQMLRELYTYRFGGVSFLELLTRWEQLLQIPPSQEPMPMNQCKG